jgi:hypothetical protein
MYSNLYGGELKVHFLYRLFIPDELLFVEKGMKTIPNMMIAKECIDTGPAEQEISKINVPKST